MRVALYVLSVFVLWLAILSSVAQEPSLDGPKHIFHDDLLENMLGSWHLNGRIAGRQVEHTVGCRLGAQSSISPDSRKGSRDRRQASLRSNCHDWLR